MTSVTLNCATTSARHAKNLPMQRARVLFISQADSSRSQMARGWCSHLHPDTVEPLTAGLIPAGVNLFTVRAMNEAGIDIFGYSSKSIARYREVELDLVVILEERITHQCGRFL